MRVNPQSSDRMTRAPSYSKKEEDNRLVHRTFTFSGRRSTTFPKTKTLSFLRPNPLSLATTYGISVDFFSYSYLDVSVHCVLDVTRQHFLEVGSPIGNLKITRSKTFPPAFRFSIRPSKLLLPRHSPGALLA